MPALDIIFDARVIQDHFPGIGRYAYNLLAQMPSLLQPGETLHALVDAGAANTRYDIAALAAPNLRLLPYPVRVFGLRNLLIPPQRPTANQSVWHFPYYLRPYIGVRPALTTVHDVISLVQPQLASSAQARMAFRLFNTLAIRASRLVITVSECAAADLARFFPFSRGRTVVIPEAADAIFKPQTPAIVHAIRTRYHLPQRFSLYLASNKPHKNLVRLVEAWNEVVRSAGDGQAPPVLVIAGHQDPRFPQTQTRAAALGIGDSIRFVGAIPNADLPGLYAACDLFVFPSLYEGFGLTPLEAMACGAPVVVSNTSSLPEVVGDAAILCDPASAQDIASACLRVLNSPDLQAALRQRSLARAAQFSWPQTAARTLDAYRSVVQART